METMTGTTTERRIDELRADMQQGFAQVDHRFDRVEGDIRELRRGQDALRADVKAGDDALRAEVKAGDDALRTEIRTLGEDLRAEIKEGDGALWTEMRSLRESIEVLRTLMIRFFAGTLGSIFVAVIVLFVSHR
jgi:outer membrane murein-binding lipoprotein Lpp